MSDTSREQSRGFNLSVYKTKLLECAEYMDQLERELAEAEAKLQTAREALQRIQRWGSVNRSPTALILDFPLLKNLVDEAIAAIQAQPGGDQNE